MVKTAKGLRIFFRFWWVVYVDANVSPQSFDS
jgi:hypothetical protein